MLIFAVAPPPGMIVDEGEFSGMAERLGVEPEDVVKIVLDNVKKRSWYVHRSDRRSLDKSLEISINSSELAYAWDEAIKDIVGGREYIVEEADVDLQKRSMQYGIVFPKGSDSEINRMDLYFGYDSGEVVSASVDVELDEDELRKVLEGIDDELSSSTLDCDGLDFEHDYDDGVLSFSITAHTGSDFQLPSFDEFHDLVKEIKKIARARGIDGASSANSTPPAPNLPEADAATGRSVGAARDP